MARRKLAGTEDVEPFKLSVILPPDLYQRLEDIRARRDEEMSRVVRELLERGLEAGTQLQDPQSMNASTSPTGVHEEEELLLTVRLVGEHRECLALASELLNLEPVSLTQLIISENIDTYVGRGREKQEQLRRVIEGERQGH